MEKTLPRDAYVSDHWFDRERDRIFESQWFAVGRVEEVPEPGDHIVCDVVGESVIVTRLRDG
jgi:Rieske 2Fe-2S family protein